MNKFELSVPQLDKKEILASIESIKSGWISTAGKTVSKFEDKITKTTGSKYAIALNSGTSAIHLALIASDVKEGDEVIVQSLTFVATVNPILYLKASPIFFDVDENFNLKLDDVILFLKKETFLKDGACYNKNTKKIIKAVIVVNLWGNSQNIESLKKICKTKNIKIIEDAAESFGTIIKKKNKFVSSGCQGDFGCYSFNGNKIITTGSGGALVTNNKKKYYLINYLANQAKNNSFKYIHNMIGYNYKLNSLLSSIGIEQLKKIKIFIKKKKEIYNYYKKAFQSIEGIKILKFNKNIKSNYWFTVITFLSVDKNFIEKLKNFCEKNKIEIRQVWKPNHTQKYLRNFTKFKIKNSEKLYNSSICLPTNIKFNKKDLNFISSKIIYFYSNFTKQK